MLCACIMPSLGRACNPGRTSWCGSMPETSVARCRPAVMPRDGAAARRRWHAARLATAESAHKPCPSQGVASHCWLPFHLPCATRSSARRHLACSGWIPKTWAPVSCQLLGLGTMCYRALGHCGLHAQDLAAAAAAGYRNVVGLPGGVDSPPTLPSLVTQEAVC